MQMFFIDEKAVGWFTQAAMLVKCDVCVSAFVVGRAKPGGI